MAGMVEEESQESPKDFIKKLHGKSEVTREDLLIYVDEVIRISFEKIAQKNTNNSERQGWLRCINAAIASAAPLLRDAQLDDLKHRLKALEKK